MELRQLRYFLTVAEDLHFGGAAERAHRAAGAEQQQIRRLEIDRRSRVLKDLLHLRPVRHWTERRVRARVAVCVYATVVEALMGPGAARRGRA